MRRMRSLQLLQRPPKCVAQLSGAVCGVPTAVREDMRSVSQDSIVWTAASNSCLCRHVKFSHRSRDTPPYGGAMPPIGFSNKRLTFPGSGFASRSGERACGSKRSGSRARTSAPALGTRDAPSRRPPRNSKAERRDQNAAGRWPRRPRNQAEGCRQRGRESRRHGTGRARPIRRP